MESVRGAVATRYTYRGRGVTFDPVAIAPGTDLIITIRLERGWLSHNVEWVIH